MSNEITHCGGHGAGEAVKLLNNMVVSLTTVAMAEAITVARQSGAVSDEVLFEALSKGSADSFVLRSHGMKSLLPDDHPLRAFQVRKTTRLNSRHECETRVPSSAISKTNT